MKCSTCGKEGFKSPYEIKQHKPECGVVEVPEDMGTIDMVKDDTAIPTQPIPTEESSVQPIITTNPDIEAKIEASWQNSPAPTMASLNQTTPPIQPIPEEAQAAVSELDIPTEEMKVRLSGLFQALKGAEAKAVVSRLLITGDLAKMNEQEVFNHIFLQVTDGDERAIIRKYFV